MGEITHPHRLGLPSRPAGILTGVLLGLLLGPVLPAFEAAADPAWPHSLRIGEDDVAGRWESAMQFRTFTGALWTLWGVWEPSVGGALAASATEQVATSLREAGVHTAASQAWACTRSPHPRPSWDPWSSGQLVCEALARELIRVGLAAVAVEDSTTLRLIWLEQQAEARRRHAGMWAQWRASKWIAALRSAADPVRHGPGGQGMDVLVDATTGLVKRYPHAAAYADGALVCLEGVCARRLERAPDGVQ